MRQPKLGFVISAVLMLAACTGSLPLSLRRDIGYEHDKLQDAERQLKTAQATVSQDLASDPELFGHVPEPLDWKAKLQRAQDKLRAAQQTDKRLAELSRRDRADSRKEVERQLADELSLRTSALTQLQSVEAAADKWTNFKRDLPANLSKMQREYDALRNQNLEPLSADVERAEHDWPAKAGSLNSRLTVLREIPKAAATTWSATDQARQNATAGSIQGSQLATLIEADDALSDDLAGMTAKSDELRNLSGQLYNSWDKILTDLDSTHYGGDRLYRERIKTVRTHILDVPSNKTETSASEHWVNVAEPDYHAVANNLGMTIAHKDAGSFDSEAQTTPQPSGFAYIAPESQGSNQYGYWAHDGGSTVWTWLPQYLILRELLWNHDYRPVVLGEYNGYRSAQSAGRTYFGQTTPASPPKYGTHGTFTQSHYADSRYVQSGGFKGSAYASDRSNRAPSPSSEARPDSHAAFSNGSSAGKRFGSGVGSPSGRRFGQSGGFRSPGRSFGRRR